MAKDLNPKWLEEPAEHNYPAAVSYLSLIYKSEVAAELVALLSRAPVVGFKAKDIFRASGLNLLGVSNAQVEKNLRKIEEGEELSPILLVRDTANGKVIVADGYHRLCAVYRCREDEEIPCKIV